MSNLSPTLYALIIRLITTQNGYLPNRPHTTQHLNTPVTRQKG